MLQWTTCSSAFLYCWRLLGDFEWPSRGILLTAYKSEAVRNSEPSLVSESWSTGRNDAICPQRGAQREFWRVNRVSGFIGLFYFNLFFQRFYLFRVVFGSQQNWEKGSESSRFSLLYTPVASFMINAPQCRTFVAEDEPILKCHSHSKPIVYATVRSWGCTFCGFQG